MLRLGRGDGGPENFQKLLAGAQAKTGINRSAAWR
jgi:hypothetical protein